MILQDSENEDIYIDENQITHIRPFYTLDKGMSFISIAGGQEIIVKHTMKAILEFKIKLLAMEGE